MSGCASVPQSGAATRAGLESKAAGAGQPTTTVLAFQAGGQGGFRPSLLWFQGLTPPLARGAH